MVQLLVLSTCICRPIIHDKCYGELLKYMKDCNVHFVINIDPVSGLDNCSQADTKQNLEHMINNNGHTCEFIISETACFYKATQNVVKLAMEKIQNEKHNICGILWFEDDKFIKKDPHFKKIINNLNAVNEVHHFWKKSAQCPTFHPCFWGLNVALNLFFPSFTQINTRDPELAMMGYWRKNYNSEYKVFYYRTHSVDIGREWQKLNKIKKWTREAMNNVNVTYI